MVEAGNVPPLQTAVARARDVEVKTLEFHSLELPEHHGVVVDIGEQQTQMEFLRQFMLWVAGCAGQVPSPGYL
eukprot:11225159-Lingulodinium_polyedra.AAC.1